MKEIKEIIYKHALKNAVKYGGKAQLKPVISKVFHEKPDLKKRAREIVEIAREIIREVNSLTLEEQKRILREKWPEELKEEKREYKKTLPPLPNVSKYKMVVTRFAPNPDFDIHIGNARAAILSHEYARMYNGKFILRFEDTDPKTKTPIKEAYDAIRESLKWLGIKWDEEYIQSLRMEIYYEYARKLIEKGGAYVDLCSPEEISRMRKEGIRCKHAQQSVEENLELWDKMLSGYFGEQEAVLRVKTDPQYPDPSVRDWIALRIIDTTKYPHPIVGSKYIVWPTYNFACGIDDHLMGVTHILRGKEHIMNTIKQQFMYEHFGWEYPEAIHTGRLKVEGFVLSKSKMREGIRRGLYTGWDDIRLATISALRRRGILPEAIKAIILDVGIKSSEARISLVNLYAINRRLLEPIANRYMFVKDPVPLEVIDVPPNLKASIPFHPSHPERGKRTVLPTYSNGVIKVLISRDDVSSLKTGSKLRLMGLCNLEIVELTEDRVVGRFISREHRNAHRENIPIIQWAPLSDNIKVEVEIAKGDKIEIDKGVAEKYVKDLEPGEKIQFMRYGFVKIDEKIGGLVKTIYIHD